MQFRLIEIYYRVVNFKIVGCNKYFSNGMFLLPKDMAYLNNVLLILTDSVYVP